MQGRRLRPTAMVTHTWHSHFRDLVAAVVADALEETHFFRIARLLESDINLVKRRGRLGEAYDSRGTLLGSAV